MALFKPISLKGVKIFNLVYSQNNFDLYKKTIAIWYLIEQPSIDNHREDLISLIKHLITAGSDIHVFANDRSILNNLQSSCAITCFEDMYNCLPNAEILIVFGKIITEDMLTKCPFSKRRALSLIIDSGFQNPCFILHKNYIHV